MQNNNINILFIGDVVGKPGRKILSTRLKKIKNQYDIDFTIANGENSAGGIGITSETANEIFETGVDVITNGNHIWKHKDIYDYLNNEPNILRPLNYPSLVPGRGYGIFTTKHGIKLGIINLLGRVFMEPMDSPFKAAIEAIEQIKPQTNIIFIDFHAEATSEKKAMGWYLDGKISALIGTHTHVQTSDKMILPHGTGYLTDAGMTGPHDSVIGMDKEKIIEKYLTGISKHAEVAQKGIRLEGVILTIDKNSAKTNNIVSISEYE